MNAKHIAILETRLGEQLSDLVKKRGGVPFHAPALAELPDLDPEKIRALVHSLEKQPAKLFIFQTGVGTRALLAILDTFRLTDDFTWKTPA
jgi:uroporphyrinogen-III synthase